MRSSPAAHRPPGVALDPCPDDAHVWPGGILTDAGQLDAVHECMEGDGLRLYNSPGNV